MQEMQKYVKPSLRNDCACEGAMNMHGGNLKETITADCLSIIKGRNIYCFLICFQSFVFFFWGPGVPSFMNAWMDA